jgi:Transglutaminase-like superfamily/HTH domain
VLSTDSADRTVLLHIPSGTYLKLDNAAKRIVELLNRQSDPMLAAHELAQRLGISIATAVHDIESVVATVNGLNTSRTSRSRRPTMAGATAVGQSWLRKSWIDRWATTQATLAVLAVEVGLKVTDVSHLARWLGVPLVATDRPAEPPVDAETVGRLSERDQRMLWAVQWVMDRWLYDATCLRQALVFGWFIRRRSPVLRLGLLDTAETVAHAWVEAVGLSFNAMSGMTPFRAATDVE